MPAQTKTQPIKLSNGDRNVVKRVLVLLALSGLFSSALAQAQTASISLSEKSAQFKFGLLVGGQSFGRTQFGGGLLYNVDEEYMGEASLLVIDEAGSKAPGLRIGIGGKFYGATIPDAQLMALGIGGFVRYPIPTVERVALSIQGYYAPGIVSFIDAERFTEFSFQAEFEVLPTAAAFIQYRQFSALMANDVSKDIDKGLRFGVRLDF
ncbi:MAG: hypothetical protein OEZ58_00710 [Gammaproteobacteria bacterium]|nr:hypothetical protein [Gammaproteobacteria bacterium]MDH5727495.1 hypothetical protein [Gammaproteobacteria bacterium]